MQWIEVTINSSPEKLDGVCDSLENEGVSGLVIEDEGQINDFLENNRKYWDYIDEEFERSLHGLCRVKFYLEDSDKGRAELIRLRKSMPDCELLTALVRNEDWENNWKQYYKPVSVGEKLLIVPQWEEAPENGGRKVLKMDPGLIFGTGTHPTTRMCLMEIEKHIKSGEQVLDLGCGSGILAIAALLLGAGGAVCCDIDEKAPDVVMENAGLNGLGGDRIRAFAGDVLSDSDVKREIGDKKYDVITANIVADVIIALSRAAAEFLSKDGVFICSGIIEGRQNEVTAALKQSGFKISGHRTEAEWHCYVCSLA